MDFEDYCELNAIFLRKNIKRLRLNKEPLRQQLLLNLKIHALYNNHMDFGDCCYGSHDKFLEILCGKQT